MSRLLWQRRQRTLNVQRRNETSAALRHDLLFLSCWSPCNCLIF